ncbi:MAG: FkbM family methyltransferase [Pseudomonadales bacterium]|nr:FkbM family methyltransferase [Pseudomonadales bacterium]MDP6470795.1 FkbM family methyltransferase [Pseudomonadales bacterium]MDP6828253.1 FkbM family methyltransferase [Pseudomonadales bacterium]MDP6972332.1 FkbM family methyltransferase [Pseudomonadales bacterium]
MNLVGLLSDNEKRNYIARHRVDGRLFEDITTLLYQELCQPGDVVFDGGANHGHHTYQLADVVGVDGHVFAVEALPSLCEEVRMGAIRSQRPQITMVCAAISDRHGLRQFYFRHDVDGWSSLYSSHEPPGTSEENTSALIVPLITLDDFVPRFDSCRFMKLDLELNEFPALVGGELFLRRFRPWVVFENAREQAAQAAGYTASDFFAFFSRHQYVVLDMFLTELTLDRWGDNETVPVYSLAVPREQCGQLHKLNVRNMFESCSVF